MYIYWLHRLFAPVETEKAGDGVAVDDATLLAEEEVEEKVEEEEEVKASSDEELDEEPEELEDKIVSDIPRISEINAKFPGIFKTFPQLREVFFKEREYSKLFPSVGDAKVADENASAFLELKRDILEGDGSGFITAVKDMDPKKLENFASGLLPTLLDVHKPAFWKIANPLVEDVARGMYEKGVKSKDDNLKNAALFLSEFFFGDSAIAEGKKTTVTKTEKPDSSEKDKYDYERELEFSQVVSNTTRTELAKLLDNDKLDPDKVFTPFIRKKIIEEIISEVANQLQADKNHMTYMDSLWVRAKRNNRDETSKSSLVNAYLERAKRLIPTARSKYVSEALGTKVKSSEAVKGKIADIAERKTPGTSGAPGGTGSKSYDPKKIDYSKTSDKDILNDNITYKS